MILDYDNSVMERLAEGRGREYDALETEYGQLTFKELRKIRDELRELPFAGIRSLLGPNTSMKVAVLDNLLDNFPQKSGTPRRARL